MCDHKQHCGDDVQDGLGVIYCDLHKVEGYEDSICFNCTDDTTDDPELWEDIDQIMAEANREKARRDARQ